MRCETVVDFLQGGQVAPRLQLRHVLDLRVRLEHHQVVLGHHQVDVDHLLANFACLLALLSKLELDLLLAGEHTAVWVAQPDQHIVVQVEVKAPHRSHLIAHACLSLTLHRVRDEDGDLLYDLK